ncbi:hypothetical protein IKF02_03330 [Candidatus Saccharibacteria bacterium]|nr:hypothetical protein [Candidatus Saccharibacteria bacterium]
MEPNNNMGGNNPLGGEPVISEQVVTEQVTEAPMSPVVAPEKKKNNGMLLGLILCIVLAIGGIGFGVWAMMDGNSQKDALNNQINTLKQQNDELMEQVGDGDTIINIDTDTDVGTEDYIYVGEWGVKIKIPDALSTVSYRFSYESGYTSVAVWGVDCSDGCQYFPDFANVNKNISGMGSIARYPKGQEFSGGSAPTLVFSDEAYDYYVYHIQVAYTVDNPSDEANWELDSVNIVDEMLSNSDNYSKF